MGRRWAPCTRRGRRLAASSQLIGAGGDSRLRPVHDHRPVSLPDRANGPTSALHARKVSYLFKAAPAPLRPSGGPPLGRAEGTYCTTL